MFNEVFHLGPKPGRDRWCLPGCITAICAGTGAHGSDSLRDTSGTGTCCKDGLPAFTKMPGEINAALSSGRSSCQGLHIPDLEKTYYTLIQEIICLKSRIHLHDVGCT